MKISVLSTGHMAEKMVEHTLSKLDCTELYSVASRSFENAKEFAARFGFEKAYGSYEELAADPQAGLIYIATPHSCHYADAKMCLEAGRHVLMEKAFTMNAAEAKELTDISEKKNLLLAEGIWTRYMPSRQIIKDILESGAIGEVSSLTSNLCYPLTHKKRCTDPALGGGALLDIGVYPLNFALMAFEEEVKDVQSSAVMSKEGVDLINSVTLTFESGKMALLHSNMTSRSDRHGYIYGSEGFLELENVNNFYAIRRYDNNYCHVCDYEIPRQLSGYEYEIFSCINAIEEGKYECPEMPHSEILRVMKLMDEIRAQW